MDSDESKEESKEQRPHIMNPFSTIGHDDMDALKNILVPQSNPPPEAEKLKTCVIGIGKVGSALWRILSQYYDVIPLDPEQGYGLPETIEDVDHLHISFPYSDIFERQVVSWITRLNPTCTIIHSMVKPGTTRHIISKLEDNAELCIGDNVVHSPVMGRHPFLLEQISSFIKIVGGVSASSTIIASEILKKVGFTVMGFESCDESEWASVLLRLREARDWAYAKELHRWTSSKELNFNQIYGAYTQAWNKGQMGMENVDDMHSIMDIHSTNAEKDIIDAMDILKKSVKPKEGLRPMILDINIDDI
jgi:hypothetical protein